MSARFLLPDSQSTEVLADALARTLPERAVVYLHGQLGAGKSTLARALLRALGVTGAIKSPTYALVERYPLDDGETEAVHLDLYRIAAADELEFLGLGDLAAARLWLIEWPEKGGKALPSADLQVHLTVAGEGRQAELQANSQSARDWLVRLSKMAGLTRSS
jgi:tRNA threonylcarbamoyladenosine biosynthesis protein TsaE